MGNSSQFTIVLVNNRVGFLILFVVLSSAGLPKSEAKQGLLFTTAHANPELAVLDETVELDFFYGEALVLGQHFQEWSSQ